MKNLHREFVELGRERNKLSYRLLNMLPEIYESKIYKKYASSIVEYAGKYAGLSAGVVKKRLNLEKYLEGKEELKEVIAEVGVHKVAMVASITNAGNEKQMASLLKTMSKSAIQEMVKEVRSAPRGESCKAAGSEETPLAAACKAVAKTITIELDEEMTFLFLKFKKIHKNLSNKEAMLRILEQADQRNFQIGFAKSPKLIKSTPAKSLPGESRYVKAEKRREIIGNGRCQYPNCNKPHQVLHHQDYYVQGRNHENVLPLCSEHHEFIHNGLVSGNKPENWKLDSNQRKINIYDALYLSYRGR